ncbi:MAG: heme-binding protein [Acidimicrobiales bacterium]|nr:heme-binding protein [Acidimicrobiales bacterium]
MKNISYEIAKKLVDAGFKKGDELGCPMSVAVIDAARDLVAFGKQDGAAQISIDLAMKKAFTAKSFNMPSDVVGSISSPGSPIYGIEGTDSRLVLFAGGIPLETSSGEVIGAIGVSGGPVDLDESVAQAVIEHFEQIREQ